MPDEARQLAEITDALTPTVKLIKRGQKEGIFHKRDPKTMAKCLWASVQGIIVFLSYSVALSPS